MPFADYLVSLGQFSLVGAATMGALGCNVGSTVAYYGGGQGRPARRLNAGALMFLSALRARSRRTVFCPLRRRDRLRRSPAAGGAHLYRLSGGVGADADVEVSDLHIPRLVAVVLCARLCRYRAGARWNSDPTFRRLFHEFDAMVVAVVLAGFAWLVWASGARVRVPDLSGAPQQRRRPQAVVTSSFLSLVFPPQCGYSDLVGAQFGGQGCCRAGPQVASVETHAVAAKFGHDRSGRDTHAIQS